MTNAELIDGLRWCADESICCDDFSGEKCPYFDEKKDSCSVDEILHAAADAIEELISRVPKWIDANERLPEISGEYLVLLEGTRKWREAGEDLSYVTTMWFVKEQKIWTEMNGDDSYNAVLSAVDTYLACSVTHWMKLPEPPKGER